MRWVGLAGAVVYARALLSYLASRWPGGLSRDAVLRFHATAESYLVGWHVVALVVSVLTILWAVRLLGRVAPGALLAGQTMPDSAGVQRPIRWSRWVCGVSLVLAVLCLSAGFSPGTLK